MSVTDINAETPSRRQIILTGLHAESDTWLFVTKTLLAFFITGWIAMRLALPQPYTAMLTTIIVANRQSGLVLAKSFYRGLGTLAGAGAALLIVALFPQERVLFLGALSLWIGLCAGGATLYRNFKAYAFVLAGYTAAFVALPAIDDPPTVFNGAVFRISEVLLGIMVSGMVSDAVFPIRMRDVMRKMAREQFLHFIKFIQRTMCGAIPRSDIENAHLRFVRDAVTLEDMRSSVVFEDPEARARSGHILLFIQRFMAASTSFQSLHHLINHLIRSGNHASGEALVKLYGPMGIALDAPLESGMPARVVLPRLATVLREMEEQAPLLRSALAPGKEQRDFDTGASLLLRFAQELYDYVETAALLQARGGVPRSVERASFTRSNDYYSAGLSALRTSLAMAALAVFWLASAWPAGSSAMLLATVFTGLFAAAPNPTKTIGSNIIGIFLGFTCSFICEFFVLTHMDGYGLFVAGVAPFLMAGLVMQAWPALTSIGGGFTLGFALILPAMNLMTYNPVQFMNNMVAYLIGLGFASVAFVFFPATFGNPWFRQRQFEALRRQVTVAAEAPLPGLRQRFESVSHDLFSQIVAQTERGSQDSRTLLAWALAVHETGRALIQLRGDMADGHWPDVELRAIQPAITAFARLYERPSTDAYVRTREALIAAIAEVEQHNPVHPLLDHLHLLRMALLDEKSALAEYMPVATPVEGIAHAP
jgi:uncharacterized membrane protein YccC